MNKTVVNLIQKGTKGKKKAVPEKKKSTSRDIDYPMRNDERKWRLQEASETLLRAREILKDKQMLKDIKSMETGRMNAINEAMKE